MTDLISSPLLLRGHNVLPFVYTLNVTQEERTRMLIRNKYADSPEDPFVDFMYTELRKLLENSQLKFLLVENKPDFICQKCRFLTHYLATGFCEDTGPKLKNAFARENQKDRNVAESLGLRIGEVYTSAQLISAVYPCSQT